MGNVLGGEVDERIKVNKRFIKAAITGDFVRVEEYLKYPNINGEVDVNYTNEQGVTALMCAATQNNVDMVCLLIDKGAEINKQEGGLSETALMVAISAGAIGAAQELVSRGADTYVKNTLGKDALDCAEMKGFADLKGLIQKKRDTINSSQWRVDDTSP